MKLKTLFSLLTTLVLTNLLSSCKEFIEPSINKRQVQLNAPANQYQSTNYTVNFWWTDVEDALSYRLQVVTPKFDSIGGLVIDTLVKGTKFSLTMDPGNYEWRVRAENGSSQTNYSAPQGFTVLASSLTGQTITLSTPANNTLTSQAAVTFKWGALYNATKYHLQIDSNNFADENTVVKDQVIPGQQFAFTFPRNQVYQWRVRAENETEQSKWSTINQITYDNTRPAMVTLNQPQNNATVSLPINLTWNTVTSAVKYKLAVYKSDSTTPYNNTFPVVLSTTSFSFNAGNSGDRIFWKVSAINAAGNEGQSSDLRSFVLQ
ncbi:hypothetical protein SAMN05428975_5929 [Mucilaginibacter sp. OK268]|uniref:hypothetical protein n=1 Tax=Mucilaginibacter sp. OK268 TaxID=1881048 RepID=UPI00088CB685|nr:hypothetical protein [Mucilaginibacter sp. OK268]SDQ01679.1 hypothetical protein SAMN05428975_5929 [Mucilaginibacter sp. OK268]